MSGTVIFDSINNPDQAPQSLRGATNIADSFTTSNVTSKISDLKLVLADAVAGDTGSVIVTLWADNGNPSDPELSGANSIATLGTIADSALGATDTTIDLAPSNAPSMTANTRYWIELTDNNPDVYDTGSTWAAPYTGGGTADVGTANEWYVLQGGSSAQDSTGPMLMQLSTAPACFAAGTRLLTASGDRAVETLVPGDMLAMARGGFAAMRWLGFRRVDCRNHPRPQDVWPVRVAPGAFGHGCPVRELALSPDHAVFVTGEAQGPAGALVPIRYLLNGVTIRQTPVDAITYYHVELDRHDILLAEGLAAESFLDTGNRSAFANGGASTMAHPDFARHVWSSQSCAPLLMGGPALVEIRARLRAEAERFGYTITRESDLHLIADGRRIDGARVGEFYIFECPAKAKEIWLNSRIGAPAETTPESDDWRRLGVAVASVSADDAELALDAGDGWYETEGDWQWTNGMARLPCPGARHIEVTLAFAHRYWLDTKSAQPSLAQAA